MKFDHAKKRGQILPLGGYAPACLRIQICTTSPTLVRDCIADAPTLVRDCILPCTHKFYVILPCYEYI